ncbi:MAG: transporter substrate-binding domain-containing protein [Acidobacteriota bacterium]|nr:MAG: transporter substrate-binding domain-containing protein [Acidobacteriota bacterium]
MMHTKSLTCLLWAGLFAVLSVACGRPAEAPQAQQPSPATQAESGPSALEDVLGSGVLRVGVEAEDYTPYHFHKEDGTLDGFEVALVQKLAEAWGVSVEFVHTPWDKIITELLNGKYHVIVSTLSNTPDRAKLVDFSDPYHTEKVSLLLSRSVADKIESYKDLDSSEYVVTFRINTLYATTATQYFPKAQKKPFQQEDDAVQEVVAGKAAAYVGDTLFVKALTEEYPDTTAALDTPLTASQICMAARKGSPDFLERLNAFLNTIKNDNPEGTGKSTYDLLLEQYGL